MFTGIIEEVGRVLRVVPGAQASELRVETGLDPGAIGASLAVDGVCLTVTSHSGREVGATVGPETLARTTLGSLRPGHRVNLERPLRLADRLGGHLVAGHVDGVGRIAHARPVGGALVLDFEAPPEVMRYVVAKGSIAVDGISLTVNEVTEGGFSVTLIPHTLASTTLPGKGAGAAVNLEADLIGKYVEKLLGPRAHGEGVTLELLARHGFA
ncbi:MAG TPA: riboflavin synthase [Polyangia bacterium]|jgi:riboflavin synthase